jgi:hypothetical protein
VRDPLVTKNIQLFEKNLAQVEAWLVKAAEAMQVMLDRVENPGDFAPDLQRAFDLAAVQDLREAMQAADKMRELVGNAALEIVDTMDEAISAAYVLGHETALKGEAVR